MNTNQRKETHFIKFFRMKQTIKYRYAFDSRKNTIDITTINKNDRNSSKYYCISCGKELTAKLGDKKHTLLQQVLSYCQAYVQT